MVLVSCVISNQSLASEATETKREREREGEDTTSSVFGFCPERWKRKEMADQYTWGLILGAVLGLVALYNLGLLALYNFVMKNRNEDNGADSLHKTPTRALNGECPFDADVIVVGAGVAGASLAHTLGKVIYFIGTASYYRELNEYFCFPINLLEILNPTARWKMVNSDVNTLIF